MAGGRGERLHPLTAGRPKPLVPLFGRPLLGYLLQHLAERGIDEVFVTAGHLGEQLEEYLRGFPADTHLHCCREDRPRGTAGAVADLLPRLRSPFLVVSGDAVIDLDVEALLGAHHRDGNLLTLCLAPPAERLRFGTVALAGRRVHRFLEKPPLADLLPGAQLNTGCYLMDEAALAGVPPAGPVDFALDVFPGLLARGGPVGAVAGATFWRDIGTLEAYREAHFDGLAGRLPWALPAPGTPVPEAAPHGPVHFGRGVHLDPEARIQGPTVLGDGCRVGRAAQLSRCVLLPGAVVGAGAVLRDCVLDQGARVPGGWHLVGAGISGGPRTPFRLLRAHRTPQAAPARAPAPLGAEGRARTPAPALSPGR